MSEVTITALENSPPEVDGAYAVLASDGTVVKEGTKVFLCRARPLSAQATVRRIAQT